MERVTLGRTGLTVSAAGLGCGGKSRLGQTQGKSVEESVQLVRQALDLGITYIDTACQYGTEEIVGLALEGRRNEAVVSTKVGLRRRNDERVDVATMRRVIEESLQYLRTETIDVFHLHGVSLEDYDDATNEILPELERLRSAGSIRFLAISERFAEDYAHETLQRAAQDEYWDVMMVGFNIFNPSARQRVFPATIAKNIGVEVMYAVRNVLSRPDALRAAIHDLIEQGLVNRDAVDEQDPLGFLVHEGGATSIVDAAHRFARHEPGCHVILTGTGNIEHLKTNVESINREPLPDADRERLASLFGHLAAFSGD